MSWHDLVTIMYYSRSLGDDKIAFGNWKSDLQTSPLLQNSFVDCRESVFPISASVPIFTSNASTSFPKIARSGSRCHSFGTGAVNNCDFSHYYCTYIMSLFLFRSCHVLSSARGIIITSRSEQIQMRRFGLFCPKQKHEKHKTHGAWHGFARLIRTLNSLFSS